MTNVHHMAEESKKEISEVKAFARGVHVSPRKARLVSDLLKSLPVADALIQLEFLTKKAALPIKKLINSAIANAGHNHQIEADRLFVKHLSIDGGRVYFRYTPRAQGRAFPVRKRTSHINLILGVNKQVFKSKKKLLPLKKKEIHPEKEAGEILPPTSETEKKSRFAFWRKKKDQDVTQVPPKEDVKGKHYTGFDRRGNMP